MVRTSGSPTSGSGRHEHFIRVLKKQVLWTQRFDTIEDLRLALLAFKERYNHGWLVQRHGYQSPAAVRARLIELAA